MAFLTAVSLIPQAEASEKPYRYLLAADELNPEDEQYVLGSDQLTDGLTVWHLEYPDAETAQAAEAAYQTHAMQKDVWVSAAGSTQVSDDDDEQVFDLLQQKKSESTDSSAAVAVIEGLCGNPSAEQVSFTSSAGADSGISAALAEQIQDGILSLTVFDESGRASSAVLYSALSYALHRHVSSVILPLPEEILNQNAVLAETVQAVRDAGIEIFDSAESFLQSQQMSAEITYFEASLTGGADYDRESDSYVWKPASSAAGHRFTYRVSFSLSGIHEIAEGRLKITVPLHILNSREGVPADFAELSVVKEEEAEADDEFAWHERDGKIEIISLHEQSAGLEGYFEISYVTDSETFAYRDGSQTIPFEAEIILTDEDGSERKLKDTAENIRVNTGVEVISAIKRYPAEYLSWNPAWMEKPEDSVNEEYLIWEVRSTLSANPTQPYTFEIDDQIFSEQTDTRVIGYWFQNTDGFVTDNRILHQTDDQLRTDYVLTAHKKSAAQRIQIDNHVKVSVIPEDGEDPVTEAESSASWQKERTSFHEPAGSLGSEKYAGETYFGLNLLQEEKTDAIGNLKYHMIMEGYPYQWSREEGSDPLDPSSYGKVPVRYELCDEDLYLNSTDQKLNQDDYRFDSLHYDFVFEDAQFNEETQSFEPVQPVFRPQDTVTFDGLFNGVWKQFCILSLYTDSWSISSALVEMHDSEIVFLEECSGFRVTSENAHYHMRARFDLSLSLLNTEHVQSLIKDMDEVKLTNTESFEVSVSGDELTSLRRSAANRIRRAFRESELKKRVVSSSNDLRNKEFTVSWKVSLKETVSDETGIQKPVIQSSGIFYDLLPAGSTYREDTVYVVSEAGTLPEDCYDFEFTENFRNSGRTMLKVTVHEPAQEYELHYDTVHSWESIHDYGPSLLNPAAYQTGNEDIAEGKNDDGKGLSEINQSLFSRLDPSGAGPRFLYTEQPYDITAVTAAISGLSKKVKGSSGSYSYEAVTAPDEIYSYRIRFETAADTSADHMIFFDSLETYETPEGKSSGWHGTLQAVDVSQLIESGIDPVIYISTVENLKIEDHHDLSDPAIWTDDLSDLSAAKAIAIDMRRAADGDSFELQPSQSVAAAVMMKAPRTPGTSEKTYNNVWMYSRIHAGDAEPEEYLIHQDYTAVSLHVQADLTLTKMSDEEESVPVPGVEFTLTGTSEYGEKIEWAAVSTEKGTVRFRRIPKGTYVLKETSVPSAWLKEEISHTVAVDENGNVSVDETQVSEPYVILNRRRIHGDLVFEKHDSVYPDKGVGGAVYRLSGTSEYGTEIVRYAESGVDGTVRIKDIEPGTYLLKETESPQGYLTDPSEHTVIMHKNETFEITGSASDQEKIILYDEPLHQLKIIKQSSYDGSLLSGAVFLLRGTADDGTAVHMTEVSDQRGNIIFEGLRAGTYILQEQEAPAGYTVDRTLHAIRINHDGSVESDDMNQNEQGTYFILNQAVRSGTIRIIKRWMDDGSRPRPVPVIHLSSEKPEQETKTVFIDKDRWIDEDTGLAWIAEALWFEENTELTKEEVLEMEGLIRVDDEQTDSAVYIWMDEDGWQWWSDADVIQLPEDSSGMFASCTELEELDLSRFRSDYVTDMFGMFSNCFKLKTVDISSFDTSKVTDMAYLFEYCRLLSNIEIKNFDTNLVTNMSSMFSYCTSLNSIDLSSFDTTNVEYMDSMFSSCTKLSAIYVSDLWSTESVYSGRDMFKNCRKLPGYSKSNVDVTFAHTGDGGYLTLKETASSDKSFMYGLFQEVHAEEYEEYCSVSENFVTSDMGDSEKQDVMNREEGFWEILDSDTWVYTFPVVDETKDYWFYEDEIAGWMGSVTYDNPGITEHGTGLILNYSGMIPEYGEMAITKNVVNENAENKKFRFTVTLRNEKGEPLHGRTVYGDTAFENGIARLLIGAGETYRIQGIPEGYLYLVEEDAQEGYQMMASGASGVISPERTLVHFTNTKEISSETVKLRLEKKLSGRYEDMEEEEFVFHIFLGGLDPDLEYQLSDGQVYFADENGGADFTYRLKADEYVDLLDLPVGATYQICEEGGDYLASYEIFDGKENEGIEKPYKLNDKRDHFLSTALETIHTDSDIRVIFTNRMEYVQNITVQKNCAHDTDEEFEFIAEFHGLEDTDRIESRFGIWRPDENGDIVKSFFLKNGESVTFGNVPVTVTYAFTEEANPWIGEYTIEDRYGRGEVIKAIGSSALPYTDLRTSDETVNQFEDVLITFFNTLPAMDLRIKKEVSGNLASRKKKFRFMMTVSDDTLQQIGYEKTVDGTLKETGNLTFDNGRKAVFELEADQTIHLKGITADTAFTVEEDRTSSEGYICSVRHGEQTEEGYFIAGRISRNDTENEYVFLNEKNGAVPTGRNFTMNGVAFFMMLAAGAFMIKIH